MANPPLPLLPLHFLAAPFPVSLHTHSWPVPIPSSVSGLLVVHINYTFLSVCSVIFEWGSSLIGGRDKERKGIAFCRYILSIDVFPFKKSCDFTFVSILFLGSSTKTPRLFFQPQPQCDELSLEMESEQQGTYRGLRLRSEKGQGLLDKCSGSSA